MKKENPLQKDQKPFCKLAKTSLTLKYPFHFSGTWLHSSVWYESGFCINGITGQITISMYISFALIQSMWLERQEILNFAAIKRKLIIL